MWHMSILVVHEVKMIFKQGFFTTNPDAIILKIYFILTNTRKAGIWSEKCLFSKCSLIKVIFT